VPDEQKHFLQQFYRLYETWERAVSDLLEQLSRQPEFVRTMACWFETSLVLKVIVDRTATCLLASLYLPTRRDQLEIMSRLASIREQLTSLLARIEELEAEVNVDVFSFPAPAGQDQPRRH